MDDNKEAEIQEEHKATTLINVELSLGIKELDDEIAEIIETREHLEFLIADLLARDVPGIKISVVK